MKPTAAKSMKAIALSMALLGTTAVAITVVTPDTVWAGNGNGADKSDRGNSKAASSNRGGASNASESRGNRSIRGGGFLRSLFQKKSEPQQRTASIQTEKPRPTAAAATQNPSARGNGIARELGVHPSELGALNAANASWTALENAAPNSRVGLIKAYADEVAESKFLEENLTVAQAILDSIPAPTRSTDEIQTDLMDAEAEKTALEAQLMDLETLIEAAGGSDAPIEREINSVKAELSIVGSEIDSLSQEADDAAAYIAAEQEVARIEEELASQEADQRTALEAAANKPVTDEIEEAVQKLLGIFEPEPDPVTDPEEIAEIEEELR